MTTEHRLQKNSFDERNNDITMQVAIIAGGLGIRLGELTKNLPKSLIKVEGKPFLQYQLESLRQGGVTDVILCSGHLGKQIEEYFGDGKKFGVNIRYSREQSVLGTAGAIKNAEPLLQDMFFTLYGDSYLFLDIPAIVDCFKSRNKLSMMTVYKNYNRYDTSTAAVGGNLVLKYSKIDKSPDMVYIDYGANLFRKEVLKLIPANQFYPLDNVFSQLIERQQLLAYEVKKRFYEIGSPNGLKEFEQYIRSLK